MDNTQPVTVCNERSQSRYEARRGDELAGFVDYRIRDGRYWLVHTELTPPDEGTGVASYLVRRTLDDLRAKSALVVPSCPFIAGWIRRHPEYHDLVDTETFRRFKRARGRRILGATRAGS